MMKGILANWKTSVLGIVVAALYAATQTYASGMTWKQWGIAAGIAIWGLVQRDFNVTSETSGAK